MIASHQTATERVEVQLGEKRIGLREVRKLAAGETLWDAAVAGFGVRRQESEAVAYILKFRTAEGRQRWLTIGRHGAPWTPDTARDEAKRLLGEVAGGGDPAAEKLAKRRAATVSELCDLYMTDARAGRLLTRRKTPKRPSTIDTDRGRIDGHIKPLLGRKSVAVVTREDVDAFMHDVAEGKTARNSKTEKRKVTKVRGGKGAASRTVGLLGAIFTYAVRHRMRTDNPVRGVVRFADQQRERRLTESEYKKLGNGLRKATAQNLWPPGIAAARLLAVTGWRKSEVLCLRWDQVDLVARTATLVETKTGRSIRPLSVAACDLLKSQTRSKQFVFQAARGDGYMSGFPRIWQHIARLGNLPADVTPHTLRHSFASVANDLGYAEATIGTLIGHKGRTITSRYVHSADAVLLVAADAVADRICELIGERKTGKVFQLRPAVR